MTNLIGSIPADVPQPRFGLFQQAMYGDRVVTIVGLQYTSPLTALRSGWSDYGWEYVIDDCYGKSIKAALTVDEDPLSTVSGKYLKEVCQEV
jgi:hypothetical protein